jgi:two-component SAPR family response regulator
MLNGPLVIVDDDRDDQDLLQLALTELGFQEEVRSFHSAEDALTFMRQSPECPSLIVSDINMPKMDGITFKKKIDECAVLKSKSIPFVFLSTSTSYIHQTSALSIQGYFEKGNSWAELQETVKLILGYWRKTKHVHN